MLVNPYNERDRHLLEVYAGTRVLRSNLGIIGFQVTDPDNAERLWTIQSVYAPLPRGLGGVRTKLVDQYGFITFCNQRDLEVLLEVGTPGRYCMWSGQEYVEPGEREWYGFCADEEDLRDDLFDREVLLRQESSTGILERGIELTRRVYNTANTEEMWCLTWDMDPETGICPDTRLETIGRRWARFSRDKVRWPPAY